MKTQKAVPFIKKILEKVHLLKKEEKHWTSCISESAKEFGWDYDKILMDLENTS
jgi:hypothetical protein